MADNLPYCTSVGTLERMLEKVKTASVPDRFTQNFVNTKLAMKGGTANSCIPFIKKMGFVGSDAVPTDLYKEFRNPKKSRLAVGKAFRKLYERLYEMNEYIHDAGDSDVLGLIVECTGGEKNSRATELTLSTFNMLRKIADFDNVVEIIDESIEDSGFSKEPESGKFQIPYAPASNPSDQAKIGSGKSINLSYTINLNLPATKDIEVFDAIFKSLKEHILED